MSADKAKRGPAPPRVFEEFERARVALQPVLEGLGIEPASFAEWLFPRFDEYVQTAHARNSRPTLGDDQRQLNELRESASALAIALEKTSASPRGDYLLFVAGRGRAVDFQGLRKRIAADLIALRVVAGDACKAAAVIPRGEAGRPNVATTDKFISAVVAELRGRGLKKVAACSASVQVLVACGGDKSLLKDGSAEAQAEFAAQAVKRWNARGRKLGAQ
ncbi:hypothetical protein BurJ1DRAFT_2562 [Burkholderiales bacterium JOSHI_001]|nr:hypothetical protein BurJ1DRAFT_2562 [Burkholderiales bacterium JOSHI_001]